MSSVISPHCCTMECKIPTACHTISTSIGPFPFLKFYSISVVTNGWLEYMRPNQKSHSVMQGTRKMNLVQVLFNQASFILLGRYPQRQQSDADKSGNPTGNRTFSLHHITLSAELSLSVMQCVSCWTHLAGNINFGLTIRCIFLMFTVIIMLLSSQTKQGTITTQHTASYHCQIFTMKQSMVEWNSILQNNWRSA